MALFKIRFGLISVAALALFTWGCAVHYYEEKTGVEHIWGFGHLKMKSAKPNEGLQAVVHGSDVVGLSVGTADQHGYVTVGWQRLEYIDVLKDNTALRLEWPDSAFASVRVGSQFPLGVPSGVLNQKETP